MAKKPRTEEAAVLSRRALLGAGAAMPAVMAASSTPAAAPETMAAHDHAQAAIEDRAVIPDIEALETLTVQEADILEAVCARLIPTDENGPGAAEARAAHYIDRALAGPMRAQRDAYAAGLSALDVYARTSKGKPFAELTAADQDAVLRDLEANVATGFSPNSSAFFTLLRTHTLHGTFSDPYYGGNANFVGWDIVGYPGIRMMVSAEEQGPVTAKPVRQSAYTTGMFARGGVRGS